ncbi:hypothetical protein NA57DRAFT_59732 [Rhizodiscina lignyota]|uniref:VOC domain-containing protein n=1 Tax=Rhizodiscina lignyota TaxID=1504668 RepID=A0A9P4IAA4_9PEZI|nr:hypothetical protein NA57DRAFT_59732 [Rhizodiscina lignyota]
MQFNKALLPYYGFLFINLSDPTQACNPKNAPSDMLTIGDDGPADPETLGYTLNHFGLIANNITAMMDFYGDVLGMRHIFTFHCSKDYDVVYMGYSHGGKNGTGFQTGDELFAEKTNIEGLVEFVVLKDSPTKNPASTSKTNTFSHIGLVVPDIKKTQARLQQYEVKIIKAVGQDAETPGPVANAYGLGGDIAKARAALAGIDIIGFKNFILAEDPDGNLVEIQQQV